MSQAEYYVMGTRWGLRGRPMPNSGAASGAGASPPAAGIYPVPGGMLETAENLRREF